jgi:hypothetical protein
MNAQLPIANSQATPDSQLREIDRLREDLRRSEAERQRLVAKTTN